jgi:hypothetical protein
MDETSLMWKGLSQRTLTYRGGGWVDGSKVEKDHVTMAFCADSTAIHKLSLLFFINMPVQGH